MTVAEVIEKLKAMPQDYTVVIQDFHRADWDEVGSFGVCDEYRQVKIS